MLYTNNITYMQDPRDAVITAVAVDQPTFYYSVKFKQAKNSSDPVEFEKGINVEAFRFLRDSLHFTENAFKSRGQMKENKKGELISQGIAEVLNSGTADIAISLYELLPYRMAGPHGIRFLHAVFKTSKAVAVLTQPSKSSVRSLYGRPFQLNAWCIIFAFLIIMGILNIMWILILKFKIYKSNLSLLYICNSVKFLMISIMTRQGFYEGSTTATRITEMLKWPIIVYLFSSVIFHSVFSSSLTSIFAVDVKTISSFQQLVVKRYKLYYDAYVPSIEYLLKDISLQGIPVVEMGKSIDKIIKKAAPEIFRSKAALLTTTDRYYPLFKHNYDDGFLCSKLTTVPLPSGSIKSANFVSQRSPYRDHFNRKLLLMLQTGLIDRLNVEHDVKTHLSCFESGDSEVVNLGLLDTAFPFLMLIVMAPVVIFILICEILLKKLKAVHKNLPYR